MGLAISALICIGIFLKSTLSKIPAFPSFDLLVKRNLEQYFSVINEKCIESGLWWRVVPGHYWIELKIDKDLKENIEKLEDLKRDNSMFLVHDKVPGMIFDEERSPIPENVKDSRRKTMKISQ